MPSAPRTDFQLTCAFGLHANISYLFLSPAPAARREPEIFQSIQDNCFDDRSLIIEVIEYIAVQGDDVSKPDATLVSEYDTAVVLVYFLDYKINTDKLFSLVYGFLKRHDIN